MNTLLKIIFIFILVIDITIAAWCCSLDGHKPSDFSGNQSHTIHCNQ